MQQATLPSKELQTLYKLQQIAQSAPPLALSARHLPWKRAFDIAFSSLFLLTFSPLYLALGLVVKATSKGPIFYKSRRMGRGGKVIECWKFRTMHQDAEQRLSHLLREDPSFRAEWEQFQKVKEDPRISPVGHFLRKSSLDELPQFWNVLKGDLSVVGPRPPTLVGPLEDALDEICLLYGEKTAAILSVRPGITGLWQVSGRSAIPFEKRCEMEEAYAQTVSFWGDLKIIVKTIPAIFFSKGAC